MRIILYSAILFSRGVISAALGSQFTYIILDRISAVGRNTIYVYIEHI